MKNVFFAKRRRAWKKRNDQSVRANYRGSACSKKLERISGVFFCYKHLLTHPFQDVPTLLTSSSAKAPNILHECHMTKTVLMLMMIVAVVIMIMADMMMVMVMLGTVCCIVVVVVVPGERHSLLHCCWGWETRLTLGTLWPAHVTGKNILDLFHHLHSEVFSGPNTHINTIRVQKFGQIQILNIWTIIKVLVT